MRLTLRSTKRTMAMGAPGIEPGRRGSHRAQRRATLSALCREIRGSSGDGSARSETTRSDSALGQETDDDPDLDDDPRSQRKGRSGQATKARARLTRPMARWFRSGAMQLTMGPLEQMLECSLLPPADTRIGQFGDAAI